MIKKILVWFLICISLVGCVNNNNGNLNNSKSNSKHSNRNYLDSVSANSDEVPITIEVAESNVLQVYNKLINPDNAKSNKALFLCETISIIDNKIYYLIRGCNNNVENIVTFGWYFVDVYYGDVFDAGPTMSDLIPIEGVAYS